jgi:hypothetical protein
MAKLVLEDDLQQDDGRQEDVWDREQDRSDGGGGGGAPARVERVRDDG